MQLKRTTVRMGGGWSEQAAACLRAPLLREEPVWAHPLALKGLLKSAVVWGEEIKNSSVS